MRKLWSGVVRKKSTASAERIEDRSTQGKPPIQREKNMAGKKKRKVPLPMGRN
jgi:hypothetical protein